MSLWNRTRVASVFMAISMLICALLDGFFSFNTIQFWFDHEFLVFALFGVFCFSAPLVAKVMTVSGPSELRPQTIGIFLVGVAILLIAALLHIL